MRQQQLSLLMQEIHPTRGHDEVLEATIGCVVREFLDRKLWRWPVQVWPKGKPQGKKPAETVDRVTRELAKRARSGVVAGTAADDSAELQLYQRETGLTLVCMLRLEHDPARDALGQLAGMGEAIWQEIKDLATIGPGFSIRPLHIEYARPLPPREGHLWRPGDAAYYIDHAFHDGGPGGNPKGVTALRSTPPPNGVIKRELPGLTVLRCSGPAEQAEAFALQLSVLELWISKALDLPVSPGFKPNGDRKIDVFGKKAAQPFTFYDPLSATAIQAVPQTGRQPLTSDEASELAGLLATKQLADGRAIRETLVLFPDREAAVFNRRALVELGAATTVYVDEAGELWEPSPRGRWLSEHC